MKIVAAAISSKRPILPNGMPFDTAFSFSFELIAKDVIFEAKGPGARAFTVIFLCANSLDRILVR